MCITFEVFVGVGLGQIALDHKVLVHLLEAGGAAPEIGDLLNWPEVDLFDGLYYIVLSSWNAVASNAVGPLQKGAELVFLVGANRTVRFA